MTFPSVLPVAASFRPLVLLAQTQAARILRAGGQESRQKAWRARLERGVEMLARQGARGAPVTNAALFQKLDEKVEAMEGDGIGIMFWHVPRALNEEAHELVNASGMLDHDLLGHGWRVIC